MTWPEAFCLSLSAYAAASIPILLAGDGDLIVESLARAAALVLLLFLLFFPTPKRGPLVPDTTRAGVPETTKPQLSVTLASDWMTARLRADDLRNNLLISLGEAWRESDGAVMDALDALANALSGDPAPEELTALVQSLEDTTDGEEHLHLGLADAVRLRGELDRAIEKLSRFNPAAVEAGVAERPTLKVVTA